MSDTSNCIDSLTLSKDRCNLTCSDVIRVDVTLKRTASLSVAIRTDDHMLHRMTARDAEYLAGHRRRQVAHQISRAFTAEIEEAVGRLDACALRGESLTLRKNR